VQAEPGSVARAGDGAGGVTFTRVSWGQWASAWSSSRKVIELRVDSGMAAMGLIVPPDPALPVMITGPGAGHVLVIYPWRRHAAVSRGAGHAECW